METNENLIFPKYEHLYGETVQMNDRFESIHVWTLELAIKNAGKWEPLLYVHPTIKRDMQLATERDAMLNDCYKANLTPEAAARLLHLVDELYQNPIVADSFPTKREYLQTMLATKKVPKGIPTATDIQAAQMQLQQPAKIATVICPVKKFSERVKASLK